MALTGPTEASAPTERIQDTSLLLPTGPLSRIHDALREQFPAFNRINKFDGKPAVYLDGPAGSQVPQVVIDAVADGLANHNANSNGMFPTSMEVSQMMAGAHQAAADWFGANDSRECIFGANMTTLTLAFSRALARTWRSGEKIVVTELDHDANVTPWRLAADDAGVDVATVKIARQDATLDVDDFRRQVTPGTRLVAFTCASNSVGSKTPIEELIAIAHAAGAEVYLDAVHYAPHCLIDVAKWDADFCVCSAYKFFGPHVGMLWGRYDRLEKLKAYKLRPSPALPPGKWMTGTQNFAAIAGAVAAIDYLADIGRQVSHDGGTLSRRQALQLAFAAIEPYEQALLHQLLQGLLEIPGVKVFGITNPTEFDRRVPTVALTIESIPSKLAATKLGEQGIYCWHGDYYAVDVCHALGQQPDGMIRLGIMHTTTLEEITRALAAIRRIAISVQ